MSYQYNYDANGNPVGVFVPINEWKIITNKLKRTTTIAADSKTKTLKSIKKGMEQVKQIENKKIKSIPLQKLLDEL
jgi:hypothetical protein